MVQENFISVVSPVYRAEKVLFELVSQIEHSLQVVTPYYEIILVDDYSPDYSWNEIERICSSNQKVKGIKLSRNFGQHYAITAGLSIAQGDWIVVMDCDLQDNPIEIPNLYKKAKEGFDIVLAQRLQRNDSYFKVLGSKLFYACFSYLTNTKQDPTVANFGIYHRQVVDAILSMGDQIRFFPTMVQWVGFERAYLPVEHQSREVGKSNYNLKRLFNLAFNNIIGFSDKPLRLAVKSGLLISLISFMIGIIFFLRYLNGEVLVLGYTSLILSIWFLAGCVISLLGLVGIYIGKMFDKIKERPLYIIKKRINC